MAHENTNWGQSVTGLVIRDGKVLLARHTYGAGKGLLIVPGGYVEHGETPQDAVKREFMEETGVAVEPKEILAIRFSSRDWYIAFAAEYVSGEAHSDGDENSEVVWMDVNEAMERGDVPDLTKKLVACALAGKPGLEPITFSGRAGLIENSLYGMK